jgi:plasmid stability protein
MIQYTLRNISEAVDHAFRERAYYEHKSLNQLTLELLTEAIGINSRRTDMIARSWCEDPETEQEFADQRRIDPDLWQ